MKKETNIQNTIAIHVSDKYNAMVIRLNSGKAYQGNMAKLDTGEIVLKNLRHVNLCPEGTADLMCLLPNGKTVFIETKAPKGKQRTSQEKWQAAVEKRGYIYIVARSVEDVEVVINGSD